MIDDGNGNFGGGGSIQWLVQARDNPTDRVETTLDGNPRRFRAYGVDTLEDANKYFKVTIEDAERIEMGFDSRGTLVLAVPVRRDTKNDPKQIRVEWIYDREDILKIVRTLAGVPRRTQ